VPLCTFQTLLRRVNVLFLGSKRANIAFVPLGHVLLEIPFDLGFVRAPLSGAHKLRFLAALVLLVLFEAPPPSVGAVAAFTNVRVVRGIVKT
jgi:hypothetical protein